IAHASSVSDEVAGDGGQAPRESGGEKHGSQQAEGWKRAAGVSRFQNRDKRDESAERGGDQDDALRLLGADPGDQHEAYGQCADDAAESVSGVDATRDAAGIVVRRLDG